MSTVKQAIGKDEWTFHARLVNKRIFMDQKGSNTIRLLVLIMVDEEGTTIELKAWSKIKAYCVFKKVHQDHFYLVTGQGSFECPEKEFSTSNYETNRWYIMPTDREFKVKKYFFCYTSLEAFQRNHNSKNKKPGNIVGEFVSMIKGPDKNLYERPAILGFFLKLKDRHGSVFSVLVWHPALKPSSKGKFDMLSAEAGDSVLIVGARESHIEYKQFGREDLLTLRTVSPPVLNSECIRR